MLYGFALALLVVLVVGWLTTRLFLKKPSTTLMFVVSLGMGLGITSLLMTLLGLVLNFEPSYVAASVALTIAGLLYVNIKYGRPFNAVACAFRRFDWRFAIVVLPFAAACVLHIAVFPDMYKDAAIYGQWARLLYEMKRIAFVEGGPSIGLGLASNYPSAHQLIAAFVYTFAGEDWLYLRLLSVIASLSLALLVYDWSKDLFDGDKRLPYVAVAIFLSLPFIVFFSRSTSSYAYLTLQFSLACYFLYRFLTNGNGNELHGSALFGGFAASSSYLGLLFLPIFALALAKNKISSKHLKHFVFSFLLLCAIASPWYIRNLVVLHNPIWPIGGGEYIDMNVQANSFGQLNTISKEFGFNYGSVGDLSSSLRRMFFSYVDYSDASNYNGLNPAFVLLAVPAAALLLFKKDLGFGRGLWFFAAWMVLIAIMYALFINYWNRYLMLAAVPVAILSAGLIGLPLKRKLSAPFALAFVAVLYFNALYMAVTWDECPAGRITDAFAGELASQDKILEICYGDDARVWAWSDKNLPADAVIATTDYQLYRYNRTTLELSGWRLRGLYYSSSFEESVKILKQNGVTHLVVTETFPEIEKYLNYFELLARFGSKAVYKVV